MINDLFMYKCVSNISNSCHNVWMTSMFPIGSTNIYNQKSQHLKISKISTSQINTLDGK